MAPLHLISVRLPRWLAHDSTRLHDWPKVRVGNAVSVLQISPSRLLSQSFRVQQVAKSDIIRSWPCYLGEHVEAELYARNGTSSSIINSTSRCIRSSFPQGQGCHQSEILNCHSIARPKLALSGRLA